MAVLIAIGFIGGLITGISPCILPVLPVIFFAGGATGARLAQAEGVGAAVPTSGDTSVLGKVRLPGVNLVGEGAVPITALGSVPAAEPVVVSHWRPYLVVAGLVVSFTVFTLLGSTVLSLLGLPQDFMRWLSIVLLVLIGVAMLVPKLMEALERPFARFGRVNAGGRSNGFVLGLVLGAAYVPCAGPVLATISVAGSTGTIGWDTVALAVSFAVGTAIPLLFFALAGRGLTERIAAFRRREGLIRTLAGVSLLALAIGLVFNLPAHVQRLLPDWTAGAQQATNQWLNGEQGEGLSCVDGAEALGECGSLAELAGITDWLNTDAPLTVAGERGAVTLVDFWAASCVNCQKALPVIEQLHQTYKDHGLRVLSVHSPEYAHEKELRTVQAAVSEYGLTFPVAVDTNLATWTAYANAYWPSLYLADGRGTIRYFKYGEGGKGLLEQHIRTLLRENDPSVNLPDPLFSTADDEDAPRTTHTILGAEGGRGYVGGSLTLGRVEGGSLPAEQPVDTFAFEGSWDVREREITPISPEATFRVNYYGTQVTVLATGHGTVTLLAGGKETPIEVHGSAVINLASHDTASRGSADLVVRQGVTLTELEILGNVCGNGKCGGSGPAWAFGN